MTLFHHHQIKSEDVWAVLLTLTFEGPVERWCHTLPDASIDSFGHLAKMMIKSFDKYSHKDVCKRIYRLRMERHELIEDFADQFLHLRCEIPDKILNSNFLRQEFTCLVHVSQYGETPNFPSSPTLANHEAPQFTKEEPTTLFVPCSPPFSVPMWVSPCSDHEAEKYVQHVPILSSRPYPTSMERIS